jgi:hypothetical protein
MRAFLAAAAAAATLGVACRAYAEPTPSAAEPKAAAATQPSSAEPKAAAATQPSSAGPKAAAATQPSSAEPKAAAATRPSDARADALFNAGRILRDAGLYADACPKFAESERLAPGVGVMLYLADCYAHTGRSASAWAEFRKAEQLARDRNDKRAEVARSRAAELEPKVKRLTLVVDKPDRAGGLHVALDGALVPPDHWNRALAADAGDHAIEIAMAGEPPRTLNVHVDAQASAVTVPVLVGATDSASEPAHPPSEAADRRVAAAPSEHAADTQTHSARLSPANRTRLTVGLLAGGVAAVGLGAGFLAVKNDAIVSGGDSSGWGAASGVAFAAGGAAIVSSVVLYLTAPTDSSTALLVSPAPVPSGAGAVVSGAF